MVAVMDRVATTWSVLNGLTMNCVQCHSHPYDPIRHTDYYKSMAFFNTQQDADIAGRLANLRVPKDKARYAEAAQIQQEMAGLLHAMETSDRQVDDKAQWKPLPIQTAAANEVPALEPMIPELESELAELAKGQEARSGKKRRGVERSTQGNRRNQDKTRSRQERRGRRKLSRIRDGEALANARNPAQSFYELTANANIPSLTAIRIEVPPLNPETARHTPENGFIVDKVEGWVIAPSGQKNTNRVPLFCPGFGDRICKLHYSSRAIRGEEQRSFSRPERIRGSSQTIPDALDRGSSGRAAAIGRREPHPG